MSDLAELVLDHGDALSVLLAEDTVQQRRLAGAEKTGEHRHRDARINRGRVHHYLTICE